MRVAIYARFSTDMQRDASIEDQERQCHRLIENKGWRHVRTFADRGLSGASHTRPGYQDLLSFVRESACDVVVAESIDRLSRDQEHIAGFYKAMAFQGVIIVTVGEGLINELHIGLKGTMSALYLKDLAQKTKRGLEGRVAKGKSGGGNAYGYSVVPGDERGDRMINEGEARIVRRIHEEFANGKSPKQIARDLNKDCIPAPRTRLWRDSAIRGHVQRGTGILNNELYIGRLVWNRQRYIKDPETGKRVSRRNEKDEIQVSEVPHLRIIGDELWKRVKQRQQEIWRAHNPPAKKQTDFWQARRPVHILSDKAHCAICGGKMVSVGRDYLACSNARKLQICNQRQGIRRPALTEKVVELLHNGLMRPEAVKAFVTAYQREFNELQKHRFAASNAIKDDLAAAAKKLDGLYDAVADGIRSEGILGRITELEERITQLQAAQDKQEEPSSVLMHPNLAAAYQRKLAQLSDMLKEPAFASEAVPLIRDLIERVDLRDTPEGWEVILHGQLAALFNVALSDTKQAHPVTDEPCFVSSTKVVAGGRNRCCRTSISC